MGVLTRRLITSTAFGRSFRAGQKILATSTGLPVDAIDFDPLLQRESYLPPVVSIAGAVRASQKLWDSHQDHHGILQIQLPGFEWYAGPYFSSARTEAHIEVPRNDFFNMYQVKGAASAPNEIESYFERYFALNLTPERYCGTHRQHIGIDDVKVTWDDDLIGFHIAACCEDAAVDTYAHMLAFDRSRDYKVLWNPT